MEAREATDVFARGRSTAAYAAAMDAPDPPPPRTTLVVTTVAAVIGVALVGIGLGIEETVPLVIGGTLAVLALVMFVTTANERAIAALPLQRELAEIVACTVEVRTVRSSYGRSTIRVHFVELRLEDGTAMRREVRDRALLHEIRRGALTVPRLGVAACRGEELHGWWSIAGA